MPTVPEVERTLPPRRALADEVYEAILSQIMDGEIAPDSKVTIDRLARRLGVSPTPVREALARLEADGLVLKEPLRGYRTLPPLTPEGMERLFEFRLLLEPWAAGRAASLHDSADVARVRAELESAPARTGGDRYQEYAAFAAHDHRLHGLILAASGNDPVRVAFERARPHLQVFRFSFATSMTSDAVAEHHRIVERIAAGDAPGAEEAMADHLRLSLARILRARTPAGSDAHT